MWMTEYKDYPLDQMNKQERTETGQGLAGVEMKEQYGWGDTDHKVCRPRRLRPLASLFALFGRKWEE